jgi:hypothetical protein
MNRRGCEWCLPPESAALYIASDVIPVLLQTEESFLELFATFSFIYEQLEVGYHHFVVVSCLTELFW